MSEYSVICFEILVVVCTYETDNKNNLKFCMLVLVIAHNRDYHNTDIRRALLHAFFISIVKQSKMGEIS